MQSAGSAKCYSTQGEIDARLAVIARERSAIAAERAALKARDHALAEEARRLRVARATAPVSAAGIFASLPTAPKTKPRLLRAILAERTAAHVRAAGGVAPDPSARLSIPDKLRFLDMCEAETALAARVLARTEAGEPLSAAARAVAGEVRTEWKAEGRIPGWRLPEPAKLTDALRRAAEQNPTALVDIRAAEREEAAAA